MRYEWGITVATGQGDVLNCIFSSNISIRICCNLFLALWSEVFIDIGHCMDTVRTSPSGHVKVNILYCLGGMWHRVGLEPEFKPNQSRGRLHI